MEIKSYFCFFFLRNSAWRVLNTSSIFNLVNTNQPASHSMRNKKIMANSFWTRLDSTVMKIRGKVMTPCCNISNNSIINCSEGGSYIQTNFRTSKLNIETIFGTSLDLPMASSEFCFQKPTPWGSWKCQDMEKRTEGCLVVRFTQVNLS